MNAPPATARKRDSLFARIFKAGTQDITDPALRLRVILAHQVAYATAGLTLLHMLFYALVGISAFAVVSTPMIAIWLATPLLSRWRLYTPMRWILILNSTAEVAVVSITMGSVTSLPLYFYTVVLLPVIVWHSRETTHFFFSIVIVLATYMVVMMRWHSIPVMYDVDPSLLKYITPFSVGVSLLAVATIFRLNNNMLTGLVQRMLNKEKEKTVELEKSQLKLQAQATEMEQANARLRVREQELEQNQLALEAQTRTLSQNETRLKEALSEAHTQRALLEGNRFIDAGMAQLADAMRWQGEEARTWANRVLQTVCEYAGCAQAALYLGNEFYGNGAAKDKLQLGGSYGLPSYATQTLNISRNDGILGQVARQRKSMRLGQGSETGRMIWLASGTLDAKDLFVQPLIHEGQFMGLLETVAVTPLPESRIGFLSRAASAISSQLVSIKAQLQVKKLLDETQAKTALLEDREAQLSVQLEKMAAAQQEMERAQLRLRESEERLRQMNENLESMVEARTQELTSTQSQLVQSEKMATLGQLIAGIAHEINTPIGAIKASGENLSDLLMPMVHGLPVLLSALAPPDRALFLQLLDIVSQNTRQLGSTEERKLRRVLTRDLEAEGIEEAEDTARRLVEAGFLEEYQPYLPLLKGPHRELVIDLVYRIGQLRINIDNIGMAVDKTKKIVYALKNYSHGHSDESAVPIDLQENIDTIITLFTNKIKYTVKLELDYQPIPQIMGHPDELGQIWTNLVHNALQAMNYEGSLQVKLFEENNHAVVQVIDSGSGIPPEVVPRIFDAFFTTKKRGEGTGLGLSLVKKIVVRHRGDISVESEPGRTCFTVRLPFNAQLLTAAEMAAMQ